MGNFIEMYFWQSNMYPPTKHPYRHYADDPGDRVFAINPRVPHDANERCIGRDVFPTRDTAVAAYIERQRKRVEELEAQLSVAQGRLRDVLNMEACQECRQGGHGDTDANATLPLLR